MQFSSTHQGKNPRALIQSGETVFNSVTGNKIFLQFIVSKNDYEVEISPSEDPAGYLGEVWVIKADDSFTVYNSGTAVTKFRFKVLTLNPEYQVLFTHHRHVASDISDTIPSSKLRKAADADRIKPDNLSDEVLAMMAGTTPVNATPGVNSTTTEKIADGAVTPEKLSFLAVQGAKSKNLFNKDTAIDGWYVLWSSGELLPAETHCVSPLIEITPSSIYTVTYTDQRAYYDADGLYISGHIGWANPFTTPDNAKYIRISQALSVKDKQQLELGAVKTEFATFLPKINQNDIADSVIKKTVKPDGSGDFTNIKTAIESITDASRYKRYQLIIYPGIYTEIDWDMKDYVDLIGVDDVLCQIKGYQPPETSNEDITLKSTFNWDTTGRIENLTITAQNMRYAIHDDSSGVLTDRIQEIVNCHIEHLGNDEARANRVINSQDPDLVWGVTNAFGCGTSSGMQIFGKNTTFKSPAYPFSAHNNADFDKPCYIELNNCRCLNTKEGNSVGVQSLGSGRRDKIRLINCELNGSVRHNDQEWLGTRFPYYSHAEWDISMIGTTPVLCTTITTVGADWSIRPHVLDQEIELLNTSAETIESGMGVTNNTSYLNIRKMTNTDIADDFVGIAIGDILPDNVGRIKTKGYEHDYLLSWENSSVVSFGSKCGISSTAGKFALNATPTLIKGVGVNVVRFNL